MSRHSQADVAAVEIDEQSVADYLQQHQDFFQRHPDLLAVLRIPHECGDAASLLEYQAQVQRERYRKLQARLDELLQVARDNDRLSERMHRLTLELISAGSVDAVLDSVKEGLRSQFQADAVALKLFVVPSEHPDHAAAQTPELAPFESALRTQRPVCGRLAQDSLRYLFGDTAKAVASAAVIPLFDDRPLGLLAVGSYQSERFHSGQGTVFLRQLGAVIARALNASAG